jgi:hypothetical protein
MKRCPQCGSIWICINWMHFDLDELVKLNPNQTREELAQGLFAHECWTCGNAILTPTKVRWGMPHWVLKRFHKYSGGYNYENK